MAGRDGRAVRRREHVPVALPRPRDARLRARLGPHQRRLPALHRRPVAHRDRPHGRPGDGGPDGRPARRMSTSPTATAPTRTSTWSRAAARQPCAELLERLAATGFDGHVVVEVNTRRAMSAAEREADLAEALAFTRLHLASPTGPTPRAEAAVTRQRARSPQTAAAAAARPGQAAGEPRHPGADPGCGPYRVRRARLRQDLDPRHRQGRRGGRGAGPPLLRHQGAGLRGRRRADLRAGHGHPGRCSPAAGTDVGERMARYIFGVWENPVTRGPLLAVMRSAAHQRDGRGGPARASSSAGCCSAWRASWTCPTRSSARGAGRRPHDRHRACCVT